ILTVLLMIVATTASGPGSEMDIKAGVETSLAKPTTLSCCRLRAGVTEIPSNISSDTRCLEIRQTQIRVIPQGAVSYLKFLKILFISENKALKRIGAFVRSFYIYEYVTACVSLRTVSKSQELSYIDPDAFRNLIKLQYLTISNTGLKMIPDFSKIHSMAYNFIVELQENSKIARVHANAFRGLCTQTIREIRLPRNGIKEVASDAFNGTKMYRLTLKGNNLLTRISPDAFVDSSDLVALDISLTALSSLPDSILGGLQRLSAESALQLKKLPNLQLFTNLNHARLTYPSHCCAFQNAHRNRLKWNPLCSHPEALDHTNFFRDYCHNSTSITCSTMPDEFNPCEDIMSTVFLRVLIWIISILALLGNSLVLLGLLGNPSKLTVPRFLMCHLAFADLCMGIYLIVIASVDVLTRGRYYNYAMDWQKGLGCPSAGFITVFASELSVFTLTAITLERWHTITYALRLDRKIRLRHACIVMTAGWIFSSLAALLPTLGVSSYSKVSICLPMDVELLESQVFVVSLLLLNILAFFCVCGCYLSIYLTVRNPSSAPAHADTRVAQRMAILIFTDFICVAPISFFAISAALKHPLITVSDSKLLLVFFYPINSCANPFMYAFFNRSFRRDFFLLAARFGLFKAQAQIYKTESCPVSSRRGKQRAVTITRTNGEQKQPVAF
uniref:Follicle stimulating hormone receptor n=1 Tax=Scophthalmus maximus TaxID=52904 RepID=A0A8D3CRW3_SCOMX